MATRNNITYKIILPTIIEELAKDCIASIDPKIRKNLIVINNSKRNKVQTIKVYNSYKMSYNDNMKRIRWTVLNVDEDLIEAVKKYASENGYTVAGALKKLISIGLRSK